MPPKHYEDRATEITIAWLEAKGAASKGPGDVPNKEEVKEFWDTMFEAIHTAHDRVIQRR